VGTLPISTMAERAVLACGGRISRNPGEGYPSGGGAVGEPHEDDQDRPCFFPDADPAVGEPRAAIGRHGGLDLLEVGQARFIRHRGCRDG